MISRSRWIALALLALACGHEKTAGQKPKKEAASSRLVAPPKEVNDQGLRKEQLRELTRHPDRDGHARLKRLLLAGEDERLWAAFGLGLNCSEFDREKTHGALTSAVAAWASERDAPSSKLVKTVAWAIGTCAAPGAEDFLRSWLSIDPATKAENFIDAGAFGLAALVDRKGTVSERTQTALLDAAAREKRADILLPLGRMGRMSDSVGAHVLEVAGALIVDPHQKGRRHAILALGSAGPSATEPLVQVLLKSAFAASERAAAAQALGRLGAPGQEALDTTLATMLERGLPQSFDRESWVSLRATLESLSEPKLSKDGLRKLDSVVLSEGDERARKAQRRRLVWLRCRAADLLAGDRYESQSLLKCAPAESRDRALARLRVIGRGAFIGARAKAFQGSVDSSDPVVAQTALRLVPSHPELKNGDALLLKALGSKHPGIQATAAQIIAAYPARALKEGAEIGQNAELLASLDALLKGDSGKLPLETRAAAIKAAGSLQALSLMPRVEQLCASEFEALWAPSASALSLLGRGETKCPSKERASKIANTSKEQDAENSRPQEAIPNLVQQTLIIDSDVGELKLHLNDETSPESRARFLSLVDEGFYNGIAIHGESPGFAVQFGDKDGDGYDEAFSSALPHEVTWTPFSALSVGMSAFSEGSQNSQIFVVLSDAPQLTGTRVRLGVAEGPWHLLTVGDVLHTIKRAPNTKK
jgi:cyclophilin family peptidyl-prolyl cis-trans isomerase